MLKNMRSRNSSGAFCRKRVFPAHEILESPEVRARRIHFSRKETVILKWKAITNVSDAPYFTNVKGVLSDIVKLR
jgi:hypothetical protein